MGSRFTFTVPAVEEAVTLPSPPSRRRRTKTRERPRVLCVDDDPQTLRYVRDALTKADYTPVVTGDPEEVSRLMAEEAPRLVLLDMMLPGSPYMPGSPYIRTSQRKVRNSVLHGLPGKVRIGTQARRFQICGSYDACRDRADSRARG